ncbi:MAG: tRNA lysidine(34) synthetase TilS [Rickettsiales bacterium]|jgi:tRNA(Ile)-lysidine synthase|nr:tRNA lysidine(34) synthetase TilS [Rickettsiales bacterium]
MDIFDKFFTAADGVITRPKSFATALSGGCDSLALTLLAHDWCKHNDVELTAIIVDHKLRPESTAEANEVKAKMDALKIHCEILTYTGKIPNTAIEEVARNYRYDLIIDYAKKHDIKFIATGHNKNEQCETFLLNLTRGSGLYGLCGIPEITDKKGIVFIRPILSLTKDYLKKICVDAKQTWIEDPSNNDEKYKRVRIRKLQNILNDLDLTPDRICNTIDNLKSAKIAIDNMVKIASENCIIATFEKLEIIELDLKKLFLNPYEVIYRTLENFLSFYSNENKENNHIRSETLCGVINGLSATLKTKKFNDTIIANKKLKYVYRDGKHILQIMKI